MNNAINKGSKLEATILSGGYTNYSYKVYITDQPEELCIYAKLCFEHALWNPDKNSHHDLKRTVNEYEITKTISSLIPGCVVPPIALLDIKHDDENMKVLITEWSKASEQFCHQFIEGSVDPRIAPKIAETLAVLNTIKDFDPDFNETSKPCVLDLFNNTYIPRARAASATDNPKDRTEVYCSSLGEDVVMRIVNANIEDYKSRRDCLNHADAHVFNTLVEAKPSADKLEEFGPNGDVVLCDWEMSIAGSKGRDIGWAIPFPIMCMVSNALNGNIEATESIELHINTLIDTYLSRMADAWNTPSELAAILRTGVGWTGWFMYLIFYGLRAQTEFLPVESEVSRDRVRDSMGVLGMKLLRIGYDTDYIPESASVSDIRKVFDSLIEEEVTRAHYAFASGTSKRKPRKSSMLRATNRRLSDTELLYLAAESLKRLSIAENTLQNTKQVSISEDIEISTELLQ
eukprot:826244_1